MITVNVHADDVDYDDDNGGGDEEDCRDCLTCYCLCAQI